jgi:hypothetical protein
MRAEFFLISLLLLTACGGRSMNKHLARDLIMAIPQEALEKKDIEVLSLLQPSRSEAVAETTLKASFRLEKVHGDWVVREVQLGHGQWEKVGNLIQALEKLKHEETQDMECKIANAIVRYREATGALPIFRNYIELSDALSPHFLTPLIRLDAWRRPFQAECIGQVITIRSFGPDGRSQTTDDIVRTLP